MGGATRLPGVMRSSPTSMTRFASAMRSMDSIHGDRSCATTTSRWRTRGCSSPGRAWPPAAYWWNVLRQHDHKHQWTTGSGHRPVDLHERHQRASLGIEQLVVLHYQIGEVVEREQRQGYRAPVGLIARSRV